MEPLRWHEHMFLVHTWWFLVCITQFCTFTSHKKSFYSFIHGHFSHFFSESSFKLCLNYNNYSRLWHWISSQMKFLLTSQVKSYNYLLTISQNHNFLKPKVVLSNFLFKRCQQQRNAGNVQNWEPFCEFIFCQQTNQISDKSRHL